MDRKEQIRRRDRDWDEAEAASKAGQAINLSALMGGSEQVHVDDLDGKTQREACGTENWRLTPEQQARVVPNSTGKGVA